MHRLAFLLEHAPIEPHARGVVLKDRRKPKIAKALHHTYLAKQFTWPLCLSAQRINADLLCSTHDGHVHMSRSFVDQLLSAFRSCDPTRCQADMKIACCPISINVFCMPWLHSVKSSHRLHMISRWLLYPHLKFTHVLIRSMD